MLSLQQKALNIRIPETNTPKIPENIGPNVPITSLKYQFSMKVGTNDKRLQTAKTIPLMIVKQGIFVILKK